MTAHEVFVIESKGAAVIDTACTKTVCGEQWFKEYKTSLTLADKRQIKMKDSKRVGDGKVVHSHKLITIPAKIAGTKCRINTEVVSADIPLLLSKTSLKKAGTVLSLKNDQAEMFNRPVKLELTSSGHYCVSILPLACETPPRDMTQTKHQLEPEESEVLVITSNMSLSSKRKILHKLH